MCQLQFPGLLKPLGGFSGWYLQTSPLSVLNIQRKRLFSQLAPVRRKISAVKLVGILVPVPITAFYRSPGFALPVFNPAQAKQCLLLEGRSWEERHESPQK